MFEFIKREDPADAIAGVYFAVRRISYRSTDANVLVTATDTVPLTIEEKLGQKILNEILDKENFSIEALPESQAKKYKEILLDLADSISEQQFDYSKEKALQILKEWELQPGYLKSRKETSTAPSIILPTENAKTPIRWASPFRLMLMLFFGFGVSVAYGLIGLLLLAYLNGKGDARLFFTAYTSSFKTLISLGLILGTAIIVYTTQNVVPATIEEAFTASQLSQANYFYYKRRYYSARMSLTFSAEFIIVGFVIFTYCQFPLSRSGEALMMIAVCAQYGLGVYVGRKMLYAAMMLHSLLGITITRNLFRRRELDPVNTFVQVASTLTAIFVYVHVVGYYQGPFLYGSFMGQSIRPFLLVPAIIALPVTLMFNFYPRLVMRSLYRQSIAVELQKLKHALRTEAMSSYEQRSYLLQFYKIYSEEIRRSVQMRLSDLPILFASVVLLIPPLFDALRR
jgi:hypothetical protein